MDLKNLLGLTLKECLVSKKLNGFHYPLVKRVDEQLIVIDFLHKGFLKNILYSYDTKTKYNTSDVVLCKLIVKSFSVDYYLLINESEEITHRTMCYKCKTIFDSENTSEKYCPSCKKEVEQYMSDVAREFEDPYLIGDVFDFF